MSDTPDPAGGQEPLGDPPASSSSPSSRTTTAYLVLWAKRPDPEQELEDGDNGLRFRIHSSGIHEAHNRDTVKRAIWQDREAPEAPAIRNAAEKFGVEIRPVPIRNFGPAESDEDLVRVVTDVREVWGGGDE